MRNIEFDKAWHSPLFTAVWKEFDVCHIGQDDFGKFWAYEFGEKVFTEEQYFNLKA